MPRLKTERVSVFKRNSPDGRLPPFRLDSITQDNARFDHFSVKYDRSLIESHDAEVVRECRNRFIQLVVFLKWNPRSRKISFRKNPFISGKSFRYAPAIQNRESRLNIQLHYNFNKFYQALGDEFRTRTIPARFDFEHTSHHQTRLNDALNHSLDRSCNLLLYRHWVHTANVVDSAVQMLRATQDYIGLPLGENGIVRVNWNGGKFFDTEVCWDFYTEQNAISVIYGVAEILIRYFKKSHQRFYRLAEGAYVRRHRQILFDTPSFSAPLTKTIWLRVYAKAPNRIRCEIIYKNSLYTLFENRRLASLRRRCSIPDSVSRETPEGLLTLAVADATERLRRVMSEAKVFEESFVNQRADLAEFIAAIINSAEYGRRINLNSLVPLLENGRIIQNQQNAQLISDLRIAEVIVPMPSVERRSSGGRNYQLAPRYRRLVERLR